MGKPAKPSPGHWLERAWARNSPWLCLGKPIAAFYGAALALRHTAFSRGWRRTAPLRVPVIVVGNVIVGGAGKTPTVIALVQFLQRRGYRPGVISRGYGRSGNGVQVLRADSKASDVGDEPVLIALRTDAAVAVGRDRVLAARTLLAAQPQIDVIVSDDGMQHLALPRNISILLIDERGFGNGQLLPAGPLRAPIPSLDAKLLVLYNAPQPTTPLPGFVVRRGLTGAVAWQDWRNGYPAQMASLQALRGHALVAAAGMAQPERFFLMLEAQGLQFKRLPLPDHHAFAVLPWPADTPHVLLTEKDAVKLVGLELGRTQVWVVALDFEPPPEFFAALQSQLAAWPPVTTDL